MSAVRCSVCGKVIPDKERKRAYYHYSGKWHFSCWPCNESRAFDNWIAALVSKPSELPHYEKSIERPEDAPANEAHLVKDERRDGPGAGPADQKPLPG